MRSVKVGIKSGMEWFQTEKPIVRRLSPIKGHGGFTLLEMVAVIAILGIITSIALPKYFSIMHEAKYKMAQAAVAEGHARVNLWGGCQYLKNGAWPMIDEYVEAADTIGRYAGNFTISYKRQDEKTLKISAEGKEWTSFKGSEASLQITPPGYGDN
jgi:prepilin-type N-terminal cleavage/methylation domain-containing protein